MKYEVVFDVAEAGYRTWWFPLIGLGFFLSSYALRLWVRTWRDGFAKRSWLKTSKYGVLFSAVWMVGALAATYAEYWGLSRALQLGEFETVDGLIEDLSPPKGERATETFRVEDRVFSYSHYSVTSAFHETLDRGGPIREGLQVRVSFLENRILRLEIAKPLTEQDD